MTDTEQQEQAKPDADASVPQLLHPDPAEFSIITRHAVESPYVSITDNGMSKGEREHIWRKLGQYENRRSRLRNMLKIALSCFCMTVALLIWFLLAMLLFTMVGMNLFKIFGWLLVISLVPCIFLMLQFHCSLRSAQKLSGTVVSYKEGRGSKGGTVYSLNVAYRDQSGERHMTTGSVSSSDPSKRKGDAVTVLRSKDGSKIKLLLFEELFLLHWIWLCVGIAAADCLFGQSLLEWLYL